MVNMLLIILRPTFYFCIFVFYNNEIIIMDEICFQYFIVL